MYQNKQRGGSIFWVIAGIAAVAFMLFCFMSCTVVQPGFRGVSVKLGHVSPTVLNQGPHFQIPVIERIHQMEVRQQHKESHAEVVSKDRQSIKMNFNAWWRRPEDKVAELYQNYQWEKAWENLGEGNAQEAIKEVVARYDAFEVFSSRDKVRNEILTKVRHDTPMLQIDNFTITNLELSHELQLEIEQTMVQQQRMKTQQNAMAVTAIKNAQTTMTATAEAEAIKLKSKALKEGGMGIVFLEAVKQWGEGAGNVPAALSVSIGGTGATNSPFLLDATNLKPIQNPEHESVVTAIQDAKKHEQEKQAAPPPAKQ